MSQWSFPADEFPNTVQGLMSLWGGFDEPANVTDSGCEKRLEIDVKVTFESRGLLVITQKQWQALLDDIKEDILESKQWSALHFFRTPQCTIIVSKDKVIATSSAVTLLHRLVAPLVKMCNDTTIGTSIQWASFMRKNIASPWEPDNEMNHVMASEYAELKEAFPQGKSFLIGPVDGDHYFYFVHDAMDRSKKDVVEDDAQLNLVMYNVVDNEPHRGENKVVQTCTPLTEEADEFEAIRHFHACGQRCVTYETNATSVDHADRIAKLLEKYQPDRFTLITLFDPATVVAKRFSRGDRCGLDKFENYCAENCCTNEFAHGYIVRKTMFARAL